MIPDPLDPHVDTPIGSAHRYTPERALKYGTEAQVRDGLAAYAFAYGWDVQTEVVVPGWGRIDLILTRGTTRLVVELKLDLSQPAVIRRAFQQADGYSRSFPPESGSGGLMSAPMVESILCGWNVDNEAAQFVAKGYPDIELVDVGELMGHIAHYYYQRSDRLVVSRRRLEAARHVLAFMEAATEELTDRCERDGMLDVLVRLRRLGLPAMAADIRRTLRLQGVAI